MHAKRFRTLFRLSIPVCLLASLLLAAPVLTVRSAPAATPFVVTTTADEFGTGPNCSLREAIQSVNTNTDFGGCTGNGDIISLPAGTYTLTGAADEDDNVSGDLDVKSNLTIYGEDEKTTFIQAGTDATNGVDRVMHIFDGHAVGINEVTIRYGKAPDGVDGAGDITCTGSHGGGIYSGSDTALILNDCVVAYNRTGDGGDGCTSPSSTIGSGGAGGGIYVESGTLALNDTSVRNNETGAGGDGHPGGDARYGGSGGGIFINYQGETTLTDSLVSSNVTGDGGRGSDVASGTAGNGATSGFGGGIYNNALGTLTLIESTVAGNATGAGGDGGDSFSGDGGDGGLSGGGAGIMNSWATLVVVESAIYDNATGPGGSGGSGAGSNGVDGYPGYGGGIFSIGDADATLRDTTIRDNSGSAGGGLAISGVSSVATLDGCTVSGNTAGGDGGGLYNSVATVALTNSTVSGNGAYRNGGGTYNSSGATTTLTFVTVTDNTADVDNDGFGNGGGLYNSDTLTMTNTIVAVNYDKGGESPDCYGTVASGDYNLLGIGDSPGCAFASQLHDQVGTTASPTDPLLGILGDKGGPTWTHSLKLTSPAVDQIPAGVNGCAAGTHDQRGVLRFPACNIGAFEQDQVEEVYLPLVVRD